MASSKAERLAEALGDSVRASAGANLAPLSLHQPSSLPAPAGVDRRQGVARSSEAAEINLDRIVRDENQPREEFDPEALQRLAESLKTRGQLQPIRVRWDEGRGVYVIVCGERRWRAAAIAGMTRIACMIHEGPIDTLMIQLIENALREDLKPIEQARAYKALLDRNGWEHQRLAAELSVTGTIISRCLALLTLPPEVQAQVEQGALTPTSAYEVTKLDDPAEQIAFAKDVVDRGLSRVQVIDALKTRRPPTNRKPEPAAVDLGDCTVTVRWKRTSPMTVLEALKAATKHFKGPA